MIRLIGGAVIPLLFKEGWPRPSNNAAKPPITGADGVVSRHRFFLELINHPVCAHKGGFAIFS
jgi:hypothetical protein